MKKDESGDKKRPAATQGRRSDGAPGGRPEGPEGRASASREPESKVDSPPEEEPLQQPTEVVAAAAELEAAVERDDEEAGQPGKGGSRRGRRPTADSRTAAARTRRRKPVGEGLEPVPEEGEKSTGEAALDDAGGFALAGSTDGGAVADCAAEVPEDLFLDMVEGYPGSFWEAMDMGLVDIPTLCLLYTSPSPRDATLSRMPSSA